jgi:hypothetical protein
VVGGHFRQYLEDYKCVCVCCYVFMQLTARQLGGVGGLRRDMEENALRSL